MISLPQQSSQPLVDTVRHLLKSLNVKVSSNSVESAILSHPDYPSLLSISDSLLSWKVNNLATRVDKSDIDDIALPFVAHYGNNFGVILDVSSNEVKTYDTDGSITTLSKQTFADSWDGVVLLAESTSLSGENNYNQIISKQKFETLPYPVLLLSLFAFVTLSIKMLSESFESSFVLTYTLLLFAKLTGMGVTSLLLWYEIDKYSPTLQKLCMGGGKRKTNCNAILNSEQSKIFSWLSWSEVGFFYFVAGFFSLLVYPQSITLITLINILAISYVIFSLIYQGLIIKQWCLLCLSVQLILFVEFILSVSSGIISLNASTIFQNSLSSVVYFGLFISLSSSIWFIIKPILKRNQESKNFKFELNRLKNDKDVFDTILAKERTISGEEGLGITLGNLNSSNTILKICNPYCNPCAEAHKDLSEILGENLDVKVQIIYNSSASHLDKGREPIRHFLAVTEKGNLSETKDILDSWYFSKNKSYEELAMLHPINDIHLSEQDHKIKSMFAWTRENDILATPTYFFNGKKLPSQYKLNDLKIFLS